MAAERHGSSRADYSNKNEAATFPSATGAVAFRTDLLASFAKRTLYARFLSSQEHGSNLFRAAALHRRKVERCCDQKSTFAAPKQRFGLVGQTQKTRTKNSTVFSVSQPAVVIRSLTLSTIRGGIGSALCCIVRYCSLRPLHGRRR